MRSGISGCMVVAALVGCAGLGCSGGSDAEEAPGDAALATARVELLQVPETVACIRLRAQGSWTLERAFPVRAGDRSSLTFYGLPTGAVLLSGEAYEVSCAQVAENSAWEPSYVSDPVRLFLLPGAYAAVHLDFRGAAKAQVEIDFGDEPELAIPPGCGNGVLEPGEACDDGNVVSDDGCYAACLPGEREPNDTFEVADFQATAIAPQVRLDGVQRLYWSMFSPTGDLDLYRVEVATPTVARFETFDVSQRDCIGGLYTWLTLYDAAQAPLLDSQWDGMNGCSAIVSWLEPGTYYLGARKGVLDRSIGARSYVVEGMFMPDRGAELEPNDDRASASPLTEQYGYDNASIFGSLATAADVDTFSIFVPDGWSVRAELIEGGAVPCDESGVAYRLRVFDASGALLASDDFWQGRGYCSLLDGTGSTPVDPAVHNLPGGTYFLEVSGTQVGGAGPHLYRLALTVR